jgi:hypothetical protein
MTMKFLGRNQLIDRLTAQLGSKEKAYDLLKKRGHMKEDGTLTAEGERRNRMTAEERAIDRASSASGRPKAHYTYDPRTNRATLKPGVK